MLCKGRVTDRAFVFSYERVREEEGGTGITAMNARKSCVETDKFIRNWCHRNDVSSMINTHIHIDLKGPSLIYSLAYSTVVVAHSSPYGTFTYCCWYR